MAWVRAGAGRVTPITAMPSGQVRIGQCLKPQCRVLAPSDRAMPWAWQGCTSWSTTTSAAIASRWSTTARTSTPLLPLRFHDTRVSDIGATQSLKEKRCSGPEDLQRRGGPPATSSSAIWTALSAAPLRRLSFDTNRARPCSTRRVAADPAHVAGVGPGRQQRRRDVDHRHAGRVGQQLERPLRAERPLERGVDRQRVAGEHRHPHARARHRQVGDAEDLAALVAELLLLVGLTGCRRRRSTRPAAAR